MKSRFASGDGSGRHAQLVARTEPRQHERTSTYEIDAATRIDRLGA